MGAALLGLGLVACGGGSGATADAGDDTSLGTAGGGDARGDGIRAPGPVITNVAQVVPSDELPPEVVVQPSANNLDLDAGRRGSHPGVGDGRNRRASSQAPPSSRAQGAPALGSAA